MKGEYSHVALVLAGGQGQRMCSPCPKQFVQVQGQPVIAYVLRAFSRAPFGAVYVVCAPQWYSFVEQAARQVGCTAFRGCLPAGVPSFDSIHHGVEGLLQAGYDAGHTAVTLHESVRPLLPAQVIDDNLRVFAQRGNAISAVRSNEAYMVSADGCESVQWLAREQLYRAQTPQTFTLQCLQQVFAEAARQGITQSQSLYTLMRQVYPDKPLYISAGSELNFKLTLPSDMYMLRALLALPADQRP